MDKKSIFIATGIYPPEIGGPAEYAQNLKAAWERAGHKVSVGVFSKWNFLPTGVRHVVYGLSILPKILTADIIFILDTYSAALPAVFLGKLFGKKMVLRTGGDFLWESYVERTADLVLLRDFYATRLPRLSKKEQTIFKLTKYVLQNVSVIVWSTEWQKNIFMEPYRLSIEKHFIVENFYGAKVSSPVPENKRFIGTTRNLKWKNVELLKKVFEEEGLKASGAKLDLEKASHEAFLEKVRNSYAVILVSLGDISPNTIIDAITSGVPVIVTKEIGIYERIQDVALFIDPKNPEDIKEKILWLMKEENYIEQKRKLEHWNFEHGWETMAGEYEDIFRSILKV